MKILGKLRLPDDFPRRSTKEGDVKVFRYCHPKLNLDISMPSIIFWIFKRYAKIRAFQTEPIQGRSVDMVIFDEVSE